MSLAAYRRKRTFRETPEPRGKTGPAAPALRFVVQRHQASRLHYDFRLELNGVLKSWAVPKGPSLNPDDKRLAMMVEDHPLDYADFEGIIPKGNYGAGTVMVWDRGIYTTYGGTDRAAAEKILNEQLKKGHLTFVLLGEKLKGEFALVKAPRLDEHAWLLIKAGDEYVSRQDVLAHDRSVKTGRSMAEIAGQAVKKQQIWKGKPAIADTGAAPRSPMPHGVRPMLAETADEAFDRKGWLFEIKWDGYRALAEIQAGKVRLYSRNGVDYAGRFAPVARALTRFPAPAVLDGEIVALDSQGRSVFGLLQEYPEGKGELMYYVFDLLYYDGRDLTGLPLVRRKELLREVLPSLPHIRYGDYISDTGKAFFGMAKKLQLEGIMAKQADSPYRAGVRSHEWLKIKTRHTETAVIAGFTRPNGGRKHFGALVLGIRKRGKLTYIGHTGGGFDEQSLRTVITRLTPLIRRDCPFAVVPKTNAPVTWVEPRVTCEVEYREWTKDRVLRQPIFLRLHEPESGAGPGTSGSDASTTDVTVGTRHLRLSNLAKVFWPDEGYTKADVVAYYGMVADMILPHLKDRPQSLLRFPDGITGENFYQKEAGTLSAGWVKKVAVRSESENKTIHYLLCQDRASLLYMVNLGCIDFNPWSSRVKQLDYPDYLILDLDPEQLRFDVVVKVALTARSVLEALDIPSFPKTSGKRGMHIYIPMGARYTYEQVRNFSHLLSLTIEQRVPDLVSLKRHPADRQGKVYLDYLRNGRGQTAASVYSIRAWPNATVSTPLTWSEVTSRLSPDRFTMKTIQRRLDKQGDIFAGVLGKGIRLETVLRKLEAQSR